MIRVKPIYKCMYCGSFLDGEIMELTNRPKKDLIVDVMDMAKPRVEPHLCAIFPGAHGAIQYVGFNKLN